VRIAHFFTIAFIGTLDTGFLVGLAALNVIDLDVAIVSNIAGKMLHVSGSLSTMIRGGLRQNIQ